MYWAMDTYALDEAPRRDASPAVAIFFVVWIFVGALFVNNLVVGVVIDNFNQVDLGNGETVFWVPALYDPSWQPQQGGYVALLYDPTTSGKVNQRHVINNPQAVLMLLRKQINARRLAVLKARAPAIDRGDDELAA